MYDRPYTEREINFSLPIDLVNATENIIAVNVGDVDVAVVIKGGYFTRPDETQGAISCSIDIEELTVPVVDGTLLVDNVDFLSADKNRDKAGEPVPNLELYKDATVNRTGARNIMRTQGHAEVREVDYVPNLDFKYTLRRNTSYAFILSELGTTPQPVSDVRGVLYGELLQLNPVAKD